MKMIKNTPIRLSKWTHIFEKDGSEYFSLFHALNIEIIFLENKFLEVIRLLRLGTTAGHLIKTIKDIDNNELNEVLRELQNLGMIVTVLNDDNNLLQEKQSEYVNGPSVETLYLIVTDNCNLRCKYCFINNNMPNDYSCSSMDWGTAQKAIDMFFTNMSKNSDTHDDFVKMIVFYGGEPLINFNLIKKVVEYTEERYSSELEELGENFRFSIITNGTLINQEIAVFFRDHDRFDIAISIDGTKSMHDQERIFCSGKGTFDNVIEGYKLLKEVSGRKDITISCTVGEHNIDRLPELLELQKEYGFPAINMNPMLDTEKDTVSEKYMIKVSKRLLEYFVLARSSGVYEDRIMRKANAIVDKRIHPFDCQATGSQIVCSPNGKLGVCHEGVGAKNFFFDDVNPEFDFHGNETIKEWSQRTPLNMPQCWGCSALGVCGGGCAYSAWLRNGSIWSVDDRFCIHSLTTLEWLIWDLFEKL